MTIAEVGQLFKLLNSQYLNVKLGATNLEGYHLMLQDIDLEQLRAQLPEILLDHPTFCPTAPELRIAMIGKPYEEVIGSLPTGEAAWENVMTQVKRNGMWHREFVSFESPLTERTVHAIGWEAICLCDFDDLNTLRAQFLRMHNGYRETAVAAIRRGVHPDIAVLPDGPRRIKIVAGDDVLGLPA